MERGKKALLQVLSLFPLKSFVVLSDGSIARVIRRNPATYALPIVLRVQEPNGRPADPLEDSNLIGPAASPTDNPSR